MEYQDITGTKSELGIIDDHDCESSINFSHFNLSTNGGLKQIYMILAPF